MTSPGLPHDPLRPWRQVANITPYGKELNMVVESDDPEWCVMRTPFDPRFAASQASGGAHGGIVTALLDSCFGLAVLARLQALRGIATLDLRIDHLIPAHPGKDILGGAVCYKVTENLAFLRGCAYHKTADDPIATASATFMLTASRLGPS